MSTLLIGSVLVLVFLYLYILRNDRALSQIPPEAVAFAPNRFTPELALNTSKKIAESPVRVDEQLPPKTGRRYIVVGGAGFLGGWMVIHLLQRGEDPRRIRILDIKAPTRPDLNTGKARDVAFFEVDITDAKAVEEAFAAPWPTTEFDSGGSLPEITVFNSAASIRFYERHIALVPRSAKVNHDGTQNVVNAARSVGATTLIYTSSGSIALHRTRLWLWPWEKQPQRFVQVCNDDDSLLPKCHDQFFSNYAATKMLGERIVRAADKTLSADRILRTGCIRPGNGIFGPGGDISCGACLVRKDNLTWAGHLLQSYNYVENCSLAHLCYEQRLIELSRGSSNPDIGGQAFCVADPGPPMTFDDSYTVLTTLASDTVFTPVSLTAMMLIAHAIEVIYLSQFFLSSSSSFIFRALGRLLPDIGGDVVNLQPSIFGITAIHLIFDDSRARLPPSKGGLGYQGAFTSLEGLCKTVQEHLKAEGKGETRSQGGGVSLGFNFRASKRGHKLPAKVTKPLRVDPSKAFN